MAVQKPAETRADDKLIEHLKFQFYVPLLLILEVAFVMRPFINANVRRFRKEFVGRHLRGDAICLV